jgi:peptide/nickel transport system substrate-binding protein
MLVAAACSGDGGGDAEADDEAASGDDSATQTTDVLDNPRWAKVVSGPEASDEEPARGGSIVVALEAETNSYLPSAMITTGSNVPFAIFDPLVTRDANGKIRPYLAESIEPNDDFTEWTLRLRSGVRFHDGTPLNAQALKRNWDDYLLAEGAITSDASRFVERVDIVDELTVTYVMTQSHSAFPDLLETQLGWPFSPDAADQLGEEFGERPVGTGPFKFVSWQRDSELMVERNEDYWQEGQPYLDQVTFRVVPDEATRAASLASGDVDAVMSGSLSDFAGDIADIDGVQVVLGPGNRGGGILFNTAKPPTDDLRVRQALAHAVDQSALIQVAVGEAAELTEARTQFFPADSEYYSDAVAEASLDHDPERAQELYDEYVSDPERSDGKDVGEPVSLAITTTNTPSGNELADAYAGFYETIGFDVDVQPVEQAQRNLDAVTGDYQALLFTMGRDSSPLGEFLFYFDDPEELITNFSNFHDDTVATVLERLRRTGDIDEQKALAEEIGIHLAEQVPWQWSASELSLIAARDSVKGLRSWTFPDGTLGDGVTPGDTFWGQAWLDDN